MSFTTGRPFGTVSANVFGHDDALVPPLSSVAVTVIVAAPQATPRRVSRVPDTDTVPTPVSSEAAATVNGSPSGSVTATSTVAVAPFATGRLFTITSKVRSADVAFDAPLASVAATVTVVPPRATPVLVSSFPDTDTVSTPVSPEDAVTVCASPASASVTVIVVEPPGNTVRFTIAPTAGRLFDAATVARNVTGVEIAFEAPLPSVAVTVIVASPVDTPVSVSVFPDTDTPTTPVSDDFASTVCVWDVSASVTVTVTVAVAPLSIVRSAIAATTGRLFTNAKSVNAGTQFHDRVDPSSSPGGSSPSDRDGGGPSEQASSVNVYKPGGLPDNSTGELVRSCRPPGPFSVNR